MSDAVRFNAPLTDGYGRRFKDRASDAPPRLRRLALTQAGDIDGNAQRGAWARGWCDGVRRRSINRNPYRRAGSGFHHGMATLYDRGWRVGRDVYDWDGATALDEIERRRELLDRVRHILAGRVDP